MNACPRDIFIGRYHDGELDEQSAALMQTHLATCDACAAHLAELRRMSNLLIKIPLDPMTPLEQMRLGRVADGLAMRRAEPAMMRMAMGLAALAATLLVVTSLWLAGVRGGAGSGENYQQVAVLMPRESDQARSSLSHWMVRNLGGDLP
jgi:anti-sigma factor RsiW